MEAHEQSVAAVAARVREFSEKKQPFRMYHGATNSTRNSQRRPDNTVDSSGLSHVLEVNTANKTALVEPNVPMDGLVAATLPHGLVPLVVMEFPGITVGGGFSGTGGESSSFRYGTFDNTVNWIEIVLPTGEITRASRTTGDKTDLFWGAASAFGTLGVVTLLEVQLREAADYVQLTYSLHEDVAAANEKIRQEINKESVDYVDGIVFAKDSAVVCSGRLTSSLPEGTQPVRLTRSVDPWFYIHAQSVQKRIGAGTATVTEYIPLADYLFRYDRGAFWMARHSFRYFLVPFNRVTRFLLDPLMHTRTMYRALHESGLADYYLVQDIVIPQSGVSEFADWVDEQLGIYPLWLCPVRFARGDQPRPLFGLHSDDLPDADAQSSSSSFPWLTSFGVWGLASFDRAASLRQNRRLEHKVQELHGRKWLYARTYYTADEFWAHYDRAAYDALRAKYGATWLPTVYDKVQAIAAADTSTASPGAWGPWLRDAIWSIRPLAGLYGVAKAVLHSDYLMKGAKRVPAMKE